MTEDNGIYAKLDNAVLKVQSENTAQAVFKHLGQLDNNRSLIMTRWVWELLQNGRDVAPAGKELEVELSIVPGELIFRHNGRPFTNEEIAHLIFHGSTKHNQLDSIGHFGSGFISTHLISRRVRVRGLLTEGYHFDFVLNREGASPEALSRVMVESLYEFKESLKECSENNFLTEYSYQMGTTPTEVIDAGVQSLVLCAPYVIAFNPNIISISISQYGQNTQFRKADELDVDGNIRLVKVKHLTPSNGDNDLYIALATNQDVSVAAQLKKSDEEYIVNIDPATPRLFLAFPLSGTDSFCFPAIINSEKFGPREERDGIWLARADNDVNKMNQKLFELSCDLLQELTICAKNQRWQNAQVLTKLSTFEKKDWFEEEWLKSTINERLIQRLRHSCIVTSLNGTEICPKDAWIPTENAQITCDDLWNLTSSLSVAQDKLPDRSEVRIWSTILDGWSFFSNQRVDQLPESWSIERLANQIASTGSISKFKASLVPEADPIQVINRLHKLILEAGLVKLFDDLNLLPNQEGDFKKRSELSRDLGIDANLKEIAEKLGLNVKAKLLNNETDQQGTRELLVPKTEAEVLSEAVEELKRQAGEDSVDDNYCDANLELFVWIMENEKTSYLEGFPVLTEASSEDEIVSEYLTSANRDDKILAPSKCWPEPAQPYSSLFPKQHLLLAAYYEKCPLPNLWARLAQQGYLRLTPLYISRERLNTFLPDGILPEIGKRETDHQSEDDVEVTSIAFLDTKDIGLIDTSRKSKSRALTLIRFLLFFVLEEDSTAFDEIKTQCECGQLHGFYRAGWLIPLRNRKWVPSGGGRGDYPSAESLSSLLEDSEDLVGLFGEQKPSYLINALGISVADLIIRTVAADESDRVALSQSMADIFKATGKNQELIKSLTDEISSHPEIIEHIEERRENRDKVHRNQKVGATVEAVLKRALGANSIDVTRTGVGSDFALAPELDADNSDTLVELNKSGRSFLLEIKATTGTEGRMTVEQAKTAIRERDRFVLCMVRLTDTNVTEDDVIDGARFITNIGEKLLPIWEEYDFVRAAKVGAQTQNGDVELIMTELDARFKVGEKVWTSGMKFRDAINYFTGEENASSID